MRLSPAVFSCAFFYALLLLPLCRQEAKAEGDASDLSSNQVMLSIHGAKPQPAALVVNPSSTGASSKPQIPVSNKIPCKTQLPDTARNTAHNSPANLLATAIPGSPVGNPAPSQIPDSVQTATTPLAIASVSPNEGISETSTSTHTNTSISGSAPAPPANANQAGSQDPAGALKGPITPAPRKVPVWETSTPFAPEGELRRGLPAPLDPVFPSTEYIGAAGQTQIGIPDLNSVYPLEKQIYKACPLLKRARIEIYGWTNPGMDTSSSKYSNIPQSYSIVPRKPELDQQVFRIERNADTVQQEHNDWGFRLSTIYGIDARYTVSDGWYPASGQVLGQNRLYSWDTVECYGTYYIPKIRKHKIFDGLMIKYGRYISPSDIEAQLAPDNYLWTHSLMFTVDNYTQTGMLASIKLNKNWMVQAGIHAGDDIAPWNRAAIPSGEACLRWQSNSSKDSVYFTANSFNDGHYRLADKNNGVNGHDNLNQYNVTWGHRFSSRVHTMTEGYWMYEINALQGGTVESGSPHNYFRNVGPGVMLPGMSQAWGLVNYTNFKITDKDYITLRPLDILGDPRGLRTGFRATYGSWTLGWCHRFNDLLCIRPEIRFERALNTGGNEPTATPYNNGTRLSQFTLGFDVIQRF